MIRQQGIVRDALCEQNTGEGYLLPAVANTFHIR